MLSPQEAVATLDRGHHEVHQLLAGIPVDDLEEPATIGGGEWSAKDLVGHLTAWEEIALVTIDEWRAGERPRIEDTFAAKAGDELNADEVARRSDRSAGELLRSFDAVHADLSAALLGIAPDEWDGRATYDVDGGERTLGSLLGGVLGSDAGPFEHFLAHQGDLRAFSARRSPV